MVSTRNASILFTPTKPAMPTTSKSTCSRRVKTVVNEPPATERRSRRGDTNIISEGVPPSPMLSRQLRNLHLNTPNRKVTPLRIRKSALRPVTTVSSSTTEESDDDGEPSPKKPTPPKQKLGFSRTPNRTRKSANKKLFNGSVTSLDVSTLEENCCDDKNKPKSNKKTPAKYQSKPSGPGKLIDIRPLKGRENEFSTMQSWITHSMKQRQPLAMYISGHPGTGKTATTNQVISSLSNMMDSMVVNCVSIKSLTELISVIFSHLHCRMKPTTENLTTALNELKRPLAVVLDEIDHLSTKTNSVLYSAFKWPQDMTSKVIIIGIANSIDLTERLLPKLKLSRPPESLVFAPYSKDNIITILEDKMKNENVEMDSNGMELCARKVAAMTGDLRTALHIFKQTKKTVPDGSSATGGGVRDVLGVLNNVYQSPLTRAQLPLQPQILLAVCLCMCVAKKPLTRVSLFTMYEKACSVTKIPSLDGADLISAFQTLESQSFISCNNGKIQLQVDATTAKHAINDNAMVDAISAFV